MLESKPRKHKTKPNKNCKKKIHNAKKNCNNNKHVFWNFNLEKNDLRSHKLRLYHIHKIF